MTVGDLIVRIQSSGLNPIFSTLEKSSMKWGERVAEQNIMVHPLISISFLTLIPYDSLNPWASSNMMIPSFPDLATVRVPGCQRLSRGVPGKVRGSEPLLRQVQTGQNLEERWSQGFTVEDRKEKVAFLSLQRSILYTTYE